jgi:peptidoglycan-N-acetylglucosamine deacetylase
MPVNARAPTQPAPRTERSRPAPPRPRRLARPAVSRAVIRRRRAVAAWVLLALATFAAWGIGAISHNLRPVYPIVQGSAAGLAKRVAKRGYEREQQLGRIEASRILGYTPYISQGTPNRRDIALTFDDGPGPLTGAFVRTLVRERTPGTFFVVGEQVQTFHQGLREVLAAGFPVGDHTYTHSSMPGLGAGGQARELDRQAAAIAPYGAGRPFLYRPPYGSFDRSTLSKLRGRRMLMVMWTTDSEDYLQPGVKAIVHNVLRGARPGGIVLMHDAGGDRSQTLRALPAIIRGLRRRGYRLVTVPRLIMDDPPPTNQPLPENLGGG